MRSHTAIQELAAKRPSASVATDSQIAEIEQRENDADRTGRNFDYDFSCGSKIVDGERFVALYFQRKNESADYHNAPDTEMICLSLVRVSSLMPFPENTIKENNKIIPGDVFLQTVLDHAWMLGMRPSVRAQEIIDDQEAMNG